MKFSLKPIVKMREQKVWIISCGKCLMWFQHREGVTEKLLNQMLVNDNPLYVCMECNGTLSRVASNRKTYNKHVSTMLKFNYPFGSAWDESNIAQIKRKELKTIFAPLGK